PGHGCPYFKAVIISTHALREEGDDDRWLGRPRGTHFYPRPPRGGRPMLANLGEMAVLFLPTPSARRATSVYRVPPRASASNFYPRPPRGGRLLHDRLLKVFITISTHARREEGDALSRTSTAGW